LGLMVTLSQMRHPFEFLALAPYEPMHPIGVFMCVAGGAFSVLGGVLNWNWFFAMSPATTVVRLIGRTGARIFYVLLGLFVIAGGILAAFGLIK